MSMDINNFLAPLLSPSFHQGGSPDSADGWCLLHYSPAPVTTTPPLSILHQQHAACHLCLHISSAPCHHSEEDGECGEIKRNPCSAFSCLCISTDGRMERVLSLGKPLCVLRWRQVGLSLQMVNCTASDPGDPPASPFLPDSLPETEA